MYETADRSLHIKYFPKKITINQSVKSDIKKQDTCITEYPALCISNLNA